MIFDKVVIACTSLGLLAATSYSQDFKESLRLANKFYSEAETLEVNTTQRVFMNAGDSNPMTEEKGEYIKTPEYTFTQIGSIMSVADDSLLLTIHKDKKVVLLQPAMVLPDPVSGLALDTFLTKYGSPIYLGNMDGRVRYKFMFKKNSGSGMSSMEIHFDRKHHHPLFVRMVYLSVKAEYSPTIPDGVYNPVVEIEYTKATESKPYNKRIPLLNDLLSIDGSKFVLTGEFKEYQLINTLGK